MQRLRTIPRLASALIALLLIAQFAGVVSSPLASADAYADAVVLHMHHQHVHHLDSSTAADHHADRNGDHVDRCCALHAFFAGVLPATIAVETRDVIGQHLAPSVIEHVCGVEPGQLDRPPRPFLLI